MEKREKIFLNIISFIFTMFIIIGTSFLVDGSFNFMIKYFYVSILAFLIFYTLIYKLSRYLFNKFDNFKSKDSKVRKKFFNVFDKKPFLISIIVILMCYLPYIISYYPGILSNDPSFQIKQYFGIDNKYSYYSNLIDEDVIITNHHPVIHTLLLGSSLQIGHSLGSDNAGIFIYSIIQITVLVLTLAYTIKYMKELKISLKYRFIMLLIYSLVPVFPFYAMSTVKDVIFGSLIILYIILFDKFIRNKKLNYKDIIKMIILMIFMCLFRNNGIYTIILSFPLLFFINRNNLKKYILIFIIILGFNYSYNNIVLPYFKITPGSIREMLSIPFQQTARDAKYNSDELTLKEKDAIDKILGFDTLVSRYKPELSDKVKNEYNKNATKDDLINYFKVWLNRGIKHPITYIEATIENTYGYFYPLKTNWYFYFKYSDIITEDGFKYSYNGLSTLRSILSGYGLVFPYIPLLGLISNIGFNAWIMIFMFMYLLYKKNYKGLIVLSIPLSILLVCFASPANTYFRYALPYVFGMPLLIGLFMTNIKKVK